MVQGLARLTYSEPEGTQTYWTYHETLNDTHGRTQTVVGQTEIDLKVNME